MLKQEYTSRCESIGLELKKTKKRLYTLGSLRLAVVILTIVSAYLFQSALYPAIAAGVLLFALLFIYDNKNQKRKTVLEASLRCYEDELKALDYDYSSFDGAPEQTDPSHSFSLDLDLFGKNSLFQSINRSCTSYGKKILLDWFIHPLKQKAPILRRQEAIKELNDKEQLMHDFRVEGIINPSGKNDFEEIKSFVESPDLIRRTSLWNALAIGIPVLWVVLIVLVALSIIPGTLLIWWYILTLAISESKARTISQLQELTGRKVKTLQAYSRQITTIEEEVFTSSFLKELQAVFLKFDTKASVRFRQFAQLTNELEQRNNLLAHLLFNPLLLWDIRKSIRLEEWKKKNGSNLIDWIIALGQVDALCSLGRFMYNHPDYVFPTVTDEYFVMEGKALGHPLMRRDTCVRNDIRIKDHPYFLIITGANMAGKSTYLRTVGVNYVLACIGMPVCAESLKISPAAIVTSLRTSDSLNDNESYFFAELKRLKMIIDRLESGEKLFIILDEILKGTNSVDKQKGSLALVQQFIRLNTCGIIATHDLLLGSLENEFPDRVKNYRFEADIQNDHLHFSYLLREGIAQNMNASFLMKKMGITV